MLLILPSNIALVQNNSVWSYREAKNDNRDHPKSAYKREIVLKSVSKRYAVFLASVCEPGSREFI